jgi:opine dehydrogenase
MNDNYRVCILGAGNGGITLAAHLSLLSYKVSLWSDFTHNSKIQPIIENAGKVKLEGDINSETKIDFITYDIGEAIKDSQIILNCLPSNPHSNIFEKALPFLNEQIIFINLSISFSSILQKQIIYIKKIETDFKIFDTPTFPYACRVDSFCNIRVYGIKKFILVASLFKQHVDNLKILTKDFPFNFEIVKSVLELGMNSCNIIHPASMLLNSARIENSDTNFYFYSQGISKKTSNLHEEIE